MRSARVVRILGALAFAISWAFSGATSAFLATPAQAASYDPICGTHNQRPVHRLSHTQPIPGRVKSAVVCYYSTPLDTNVTTVQSVEVGKAAYFGKLLNGSKPGSFVQCMVYYPFHYAIIFTLRDGHRVYLYPVMCGPLISNASDKAFQMSPAAAAYFDKLKTAFN